MWNCLHLKKLFVLFTLTVQLSQLIYVSHKKVFYFQKKILNSTKQPKNMVWKQSLKLIMMKLQKMKLLKELLDQLPTIPLQKTKQLTILKVQTRKVNNRSNKNRKNLVCSYFRWTVNKRSRTGPSIGVVGDPSRTEENGLPRRCRVP